MTLRGEDAGKERRAATGAMGEGQNMHIFRKGTANGHARTSQEDRKGMGKRERIGSKAN